MIVALHVATGAAVGAATGSHAAAVVTGPLLHLAGDGPPREDFVAPGAHASYAIAVDPRGKLAWASGDVDGILEDDPMCMHTTVSVSAHARKNGSQ